MLGDDDFNTHYQEHYKTEEGPPHPCGVCVCVSIHSDLWWIQDMALNKKNPNQHDFEMASDDEIICWEVVLMLRLPI